MSEPDPPTSDHQRCNRHDGRGWRCKRLVMDGKTLCEIHYVQGRLCSSKRKVPESLKLQRPKSNSKSKRKVPDSPPPVTLDEDADNGGIRANLNRRRTRKRSRPSDEADADDLAEKKTKNKAEELLRVFVKREIERKKKRRKADGFFSLARRDFSAPTASKKVCLGVCECKACLPARLKDVSSQEVLKKEFKVTKYLSQHYLIGLVLPILERINLEQRMELEMEAKSKGLILSEAEAPQVEIDAKKQLFCNRCSFSIVDLHRSCPNCSYKLCLSCC